MIPNNYGIGFAIWRRGKTDCAWIVIPEGSGATPEFLAELETLPKALGVLNWLVEAPDWYGDAWKPCAEKVTAYQSATLRGMPL